MLDALGTYVDHLEREERERQAWAQRVADDFMAGFYVAMVQLTGPAIVPIPPLRPDRALVRTDCAPPRPVRPGGRHWRVSKLPADPLLRVRRPVIDLATGEPVPGLFCTGEVFMDCYVSDEAFRRLRVAED